MKRVLTFAVSMGLAWSLCFETTYANDGDTYIVQPGDSLYRIAVNHGISLEELESWNNIPNGTILPGMEIVIKNGTYNVITQSDSSASVNTEVQKLLNEFKDFPVSIYIEELNTENPTHASVNVDGIKSTGNASRIILVAYVHDQVQKGNFSWNDDIKKDISAVPEYFYTGFENANTSEVAEFTIETLIAGVVNNDSDAYLTLVNFLSDETDDIDTFTESLIGKSFTLDVNTKDIAQVMTYLYFDADTTLDSILENAKGPLSNATTFQMGAESSDSIHATGIILGDTDYVVSVMSDHYDSDFIRNTALRIQDSMRYSNMELFGFTGDGRVHQDVTKAIYEYKDLPVYIHFQSLDAHDKSFSTLKGKDVVHGASVPKVVLTLYALERVNDGTFSWDDTFKYTDDIYERDEAYSRGGSGTIGHEENYWNNSYTLEDLVKRTIVNSDNIASNMLLHYIGYEDKEHFDDFTNRLYGSDYTLWVTPEQMTKVMYAIYQHEDKTLLSMFETTDYDGIKLDAVAGKTYQKIGQVNGHSNHSTAVVTGDYNYAITVMSTEVSDAVISEIAKAIYEAAQP